MNRRVFLAGALAMALARRAAAQETAPKVQVVGVFLPLRKSRPDGSPRPLPFGIRERLARHGFVDGKNIRLEVVDGNIDLRGLDQAEATERLKAPARQLLARNPDILLVPYGGVNVLWELTRSIPIVFGSSTAEVVDALKDVRPPLLNVTGVALRYHELAEKRIEVVRELLPRARRVAVIADHGLHKSRLFPSALEDAAKRVGLQVIHGDVSAHRGDLDATLSEVLRARPDAFLPYGNLDFGPLVAFESSQRIPQVDGGSCPTEEAKAATICYGEDWEAHYDRFVEIAATILKGARPADIPIDVTARFAVVVNRKRAEQIGVEVPPSILVRANTIIQ